MNETLELVPDLAPEIVVLNSTLKKPLKVLRTVSEDKKWLVEKIYETPGGIIRAYPNITNDHTVNIFSLRKLVL